MIIDKPAAVDAWTLFGSANGLFLIIPISESQAYCYISRRKDDDLSKEAYLEPFRTFADPVAGILKNESLKKAYWSKVEELAPLSQYGKGRIVLIGDARSRHAAFYGPRRLFGLRRRVCTIQNDRRNRRRESRTKIFRNTNGKSRLGKNAKSETGKTVQIAVLDNQNRLGSCWERKIGRKIIAL